MELAALSITEWLALFGAAAAAVVALYLLRMRRRRVAVPFIALWESLLQDRRSSRLFSRLRHLWSLLVALAIVALLSLAAADPRPSAASASARHLLLLVDAGVTMQATDVAPTRLGAAVARARELVRAAGNHERVLVAQFDATTTPLSPFTNERNVLEQALGQIAATDLASDPQQAYRFALDVLSGRAAGEVVVLSDAASAPDPELAAALARAKIRLTHLPVGRRGDNAGIGAFAVRRYPLDKNRSELLVELYSTSNHPETLELTLLGDGAPVDVQRVTLEPGQTVRRVYDDVTGVARTLEARLAVAGDHDDLAADDRAYAALPDRKRSRVLCVTSGNLYLEAALLLDEYLAVDVVEPTSYRSAAGYDVVIFDRFAPPEPPGVPALYLAAPAAQGNPLPAQGTIERPFFDRLDGKHRVLRFTALRDVNVAQAALVRPAPGDQVLAADARGPLIVAGERDSLRFVALTFDVRASDLPLRVAWPMLVLNAIDWFTVSDEDDASASSVGRPVTIELPDGVAEVVLHDPNGQTRELFAEGGKVVFTPVRAGFHRVVWDGGQRVVAGNLSERSRRDLAPPEQRAVAPSGAPAGAMSARAVAQPPWVLLACAALLVLLFEWVAYHRRWTI